MISMLPYANSWKKELKCVVMEVKDLCFIITIVFLTGVNSLTKQQLKNASKMLKKSCMAKNQVTEDQVGSIDKGKFVEDKQVMCYIACIYEMSGVIKNNKLNHEASLKQVDLMYPAELKASAKAAIEKCKDIQKKYKDICEASYWAAKCVYDFKPEDFVFP